MFFDHEFDLGPLTFLRIVLVPGAAASCALVIFSFAENTAAIRVLREAQNWPLGICCTKNLSALEIRKGLGSHDFQRS